MANVDLLLPFIMKWEGGFVNDPADAGGETNKGVTMSTWRKVGYDKDDDGDIDVDDLKLLSDADVRNKVLKPAYWDRWKADGIRSQKVANILVDWVWCSGKNGIVIPQRLLGVTQDGMVGPMTLAAVNNRDERVFFESVYKARVDFLYNIVGASVIEYGIKMGHEPSEAELMRYTKKRFLKGWLRRLEDLRTL